MAGNRGPFRGRGRGESSRDNSKYPKSSNDAVLAVSSFGSPDGITVCASQQPFTEGEGQSPLGRYRNKTTHPLSERVSAEGDYGDADKNVNRGTDRPFESDLRQWERWALQATARRVLDDDARLNKCMRWMLGGMVSVVQAASGQCSYGGVETCGSVWRCAICASKIAQRRKGELATLIERHCADGGSVALVTRTFPHYAWVRLDGMLEKFLQAEQSFKRGRSFEAIRRACGLVGTVKALEVTHGEHGFHPHGHELWLISADEWREDPELRDDVLDMARFLWGRVCERAGLPLPSWQRGLTIEGGRRAAEYVAKFGEVVLVEDGDDYVSVSEQKPSWGIEDELTKAHIKKGKLKGRTPWDLLRAVLNEGDEAAGELFREYARAFYRKRQLRWSKGLRDLYDLGEETTDEDLAAETAEGALLGELEFADWRLIVKADAQWAVLSAAQDRGWAGVVSVLEGLRYGV